MINNGRQEDLMKVFDKTWKANHNDDLKRVKEKDKKFMDKMFGNSSGTNNKNLTPGQRVENLHNNMNNAFMGHRQNNLNNIVKKWK